MNVNFFIFQRVVFFLFASWLSSHLSAFIITLLRFLFFVFWLNCPSPFSFYKIVSLFFWILFLYHTYFDRNNPVLFFFKYVCFLPFSPFACFLAFVHSFFGFICLNFSFAFFCSSFSSFYNFYFPYRAYLIRENSFFFLRFEISAHFSFVLLTFTFLFCQLTSIKAI